MKKSSKKILGLITSSLLALSATHIQAQQEVTIQTTDLGSGVYMLQGQGGNIGVFAGEDGVFMIDDQFAPLSEKIKSAIADISEEPIKFLINTHWHFDHTGGNENFANSGSIIVAHENVHKRMSTDQLMQAFNREVKASPKLALPVVTFNQQVGFHLNNDYINVMHVANAHTDGDAIIYFEQANVIHMGDTFFNGTYPFIDVGSGGSLKGVIAAAEKALSIVNDETDIIPGHGPLATVSDLKNYHAILSDIHLQFTALKKQGLSNEDIKAEGITLEYDEELGNGFIGPEKFIEILLSQEQTNQSTGEIIKPNKTDLHDHGAGQSAHKH